MTDPVPSAPTTAATTGTVTTRLVHRAPVGSPEWWRSAVVYVNEPPLVSGTTTLTEVAERVEQIRAVSRLGVQAVRIGCPPLPGEAPEEAIDAVVGLLTRAHRTGLRVVLRIDPLDPREEACARYWLSRGADGLDLGPVTESEPVSHARYRELHAVLAEHARDEDPILSTRLSPATQSRVADMLHEDWLHHLVDADLLDVGDPALVRESVTESLRIRDALGSAGAWLVPDVLEAGSPELALATALVVLAMPGAVYLRQGIELGMPVKTTQQPEPERLTLAARLKEEQRGQTGSSFEIVRAALRLRGDHRLGLAPLAWVDELGGPVPDTVLAFLSGEVLVVVNVGDDDVPLSPEREVLLSSGPLTERPDGRLLLPPRTAVWQWLEPQPRENDPRVRR
ncbi:hypothetical protein M3148_01060 [Georgenia satyanarayanai]|uniref:DUF3459 domain-containing protein n=1 Tax=Georgenia satyanarayanai TaxID=860221 RepID=UPI00203D7251|nr:hypothetical protein [Georgenia satyanarayanai]MCM3659586.1 hypothetical protein [Georgenia satyanarayanai]